MRVITGSARGRRLETMSGDATRPTTERVKEGVFSAIQFDIPGRRILDLFAGSGQLGIEALSRGAASCVFVDKQPQAVEIIRRNLQTTGLASMANVTAMTAEAFLARTKDCFDILFMDPPYAAELLPVCLPLAASHVAPGGLIVCESDAGQVLPDTVGTFSKQRIYRYGRVYITIYR